MKLSFSKKHTRIFTAILTACFFMSFLLPILSDTVFAADNVVATRDHWISTPVITGSSGSAVYTLGGNSRGVCVNPGKASPNGVSGHTTTMTLTGAYLGNNSYDQILKSYGMTRGQVLYSISQLLQTTNDNTVWAVCHVIGSIAYNNNYTCLDGFSVNPQAFGTTVSSIVNAWRAAGGANCPSTFQVWVPNDSRYQTLIIYGNPPSRPTDQALHTSYYITKVTDDGRKAVGAVFELIDGNGQRVGLFTDLGNGNYLYADDFWGNVNSDITLDRYYREVSGPTHAIEADGTKTPISVAPTDVDRTTYKISVTYSIGSDSLTFLNSLPNGERFGNPNGIAYTNWSTTWDQHPIYLYSSNRLNGGWVNRVSTPVYMDTSISLQKEDQSGNRARGAAFTVYSDANCTNRVGIMTDATNTGSYSFTLSGAAANNFFTTPLENGAVVTKDLYIKETSSATQVEINGSWVNRTTAISQNTWRIHYSWNPSTSKVDWTLYVNGRVINSGSNTRAGVDKSIPTHAIVAFGVGNAVVNPVLGSIELHKVDESHSILTGATFELLDGNRNVIATFTDTTVSNNGLMPLGATEDGTYEVINLPVGTYYVREIDAPDGWEIDPNTYSVVISTEIPHRVVDNASTRGTDGEFINVAPEIHTTLVDSTTETHTATTLTTVVLDDTVSFEDLIVGQSYSMTGRLYYTDDGTPVCDANGDPITATTSFVPETSSGTVVVTFTFEYLAEYTNRSVVAFEDCRNESTGRTVATHADLNDQSQTVSFPSVGTTLISDATREHVAPVDTMISLTDTVKVSNVVVGEIYSINGILMNLATGEPLKDAAGNEITGTTTFTATSTYMEVNVVFRFNSSLLANTTVVAFESLLSNGIPVATHNDLSDLEQTVNIPNIGTQFYDRDFGMDSDMVAYGETVELVDLVSYSNITPNLMYTVFGEIHIKETGEVLTDSEGNPIVATANFIPTTSSGTTEVTFVIDTTKLEGKTLVAFETLSYNNITLVVHADINDVNQTVKVPTIGTQLTESSTNTHTVTYEEDVVLNDVISYSALQPNREYVANGTLHLEDGSVLMQNGQPVTATATFTSSATGNGTATVTFHFNSVILTKEITKIVAFESVSDRETGIVVAVHADVEDEGQTVIVPSIGTTATVNGSHTFKPSDNITLNDLVTYVGLEPNRQYRLEAQLMNSDGTAFKIDGKAATATGTFTASATGDGSTNVISFTFNGSSLVNGQKLVVFETLIDVQTGKVIAVHKDINSQGQTVTVELVPRTGESSNIYRSIRGVCYIMLGGLALYTWKTSKSKEEDEERS